MHNDDLNALEIEHLMVAQSWQQKFKVLTQWGDLVSLKTELRREEFLVKGCETQAWLCHQIDGQLNQFYFDAESKIIRGLGALLLSQFNGKSTERMKTVTLAQQFQELGLAKYLSPSRANGFRALANRCYTLAGLPPLL